MESHCLEFVDFSYGDRFFFHWNRFFSQKETVPVEKEAILMKKGEKNVK